ncbi:hypothetical protein GPECTOR_483g422 [Gonium pectorale]|uniref:Uncharacterized protein n=1 Tax=Gonium pectorale TaxID=33097 RepID=A0A150FUW1_GONPE|nr:hypothetical protein GPECTOR_483g422 [Gonium pectorale]|eukprot:KXZ41413.1 hypothetical protein GPECTOR_483g422 [Gonium pectorale]
MRLPIAPPPRTPDRTAAHPHHRAIEEVIKEAEQKAGADGIRDGVSGPLTRVVSRSGAVMWLCPCHVSAHVWCT